MSFNLIEAGLIKNVNDALVHSFKHLHAFKESKEVSDLKWSVISAVQAGELLSDVLLIRTDCPSDVLLKVRKKTNQAVFCPPSFEQGLLELLEEHAGKSVSPIKVPAGELSLLKNAKDLALVRNELMHKTLIDLNDLDNYAKAALSILLVFEFRCHRVVFPEIESAYRIDREVTFLLSWLKGEASAHFKQATAYLKSVNAPKNDFMTCPNCGSAYAFGDTCQVCRAELIPMECLQCNQEWFELREDDHLAFKCPECGN